MLATIRSVLSPARDLAFILVPAATIHHPGENLFAEAKMHEAV
jgi:hypothetical protein